MTVEICEGSAKILSENRVFYNPVQQFNRDLSLSVLSTFWKLCQNESEQRKNGIKVPGNDFSVNMTLFSKELIEFRNMICLLPPFFCCNTIYLFFVKNGLRVLEALSATGLRSIRYAKEVPGIKEIIANDLSRSAVKSIRDNIKLNNVEHLVTASEANAITLMHNSTSTQNRFDAIDLGILIIFGESEKQTISNIHIHFI